MLKRSMRSRSLHTPNVTENEVETAITNLLNGSKVSDLPTRLCQSVITTLTHRRKEAILACQDDLAVKMERILGELRYGPERYYFATPGDPEAARERTLSIKSCSDLKTDTFS
jgi:hypothetical protein